MDMSTDPIFILSCERSGSTMLRYIVDTHSKIACPSHLYLGCVLEDLNRMLTATIAQTQAGLSEEERKNLAIAETRNIVSEIMSRYTASKGKLFWCEKTPMNLEYLAVLDSHFPNAKYICLYRHGMDVVHSSINLSKYRFLPEHIPYVYKNPGNIVAAMLENWLDKTNKLLAFEAEHAERSFRVNYESIVLYPEETLKRLFDFLQVGWDEGLIERVFHSPHDVGEGDGKAALSSHIRQNSLGKGVEVPRSTIPDKYRQGMEELLIKLGYDSLESYYAKKEYSPNTNIENSRPKQDAVADLFENRFRQAVDKNRPLYPMLDGVWKIVVNGDADNAWFVDLSNNNGKIQQRGLKEDFVICLSDSLLFDLLSGQRDAVEAYLREELTVLGISDRELLSNFGRLIFS